MCSIVEDDFGDDGGLHAMAEPIDEESAIPDEICKKCNEHKVVVKLNLKDGQCKNCFLNFVRHKFRAALGSTKIVKRDSNILLIFDGAAENVVMLDMIKYAVEQDTYKKLLFHPVTLYVDEHFLFEKDLVKREDRLKDVKRITSQFNFKNYYCNLSDPDNSVSLLHDITDLKQNTSLEAKFMESLESVKSLTSRQDYLKQTKSNLYRSVAKHLNCSYIFLSEIGIDLSKSLLTNIALGRGSSAALDIAFCDDRMENIKLLRPVRDLHKNELEHYIEFIGLEYLEELRYGASQGDHLSIQNLTASFIDGLQKSFPSTVSTVYRTGDKISHVQQSTENKLSQQLDDVLILNENTCRFCKSKLDYKDSTTLFAIEYSRLVSSLADTLKTSEIIEERALSAVNGLDDVDANATETSNLKQFLCHGCRNLYLDFSNVMDVK